MKDELGEAQQEGVGGFLNRRSGTTADIEVFGCSY
jgi:hypothetical protein